MSTVSTNLNTISEPVVERKKSLVAGIIQASAKTKKVHRHIVVYLPANYPSCPPGLEKLIFADHLFIRQGMREQEPPYAMITKSKFEVLNGQGERIFLAKESTDNILKLCCRGGCGQPFEMSIKDRHSGYEILAVNGHPDCYGAMAACISQNGMSLGFVNEELRCCSSNYIVIDAQGNEIFRIYDMGGSFRNIKYTKEAPIPILIGNTHPFVNGTNRIPTSITPTTTTTTANSKESGADIFATTTSTTRGNDNNHKNPENPNNNNHQVGANGSSGDSSSSATDPLSSSTVTASALAMAALTSVTSLSLPESLTEESYIEPSSSTTATIPSCDTKSTLEDDTRKKMTMGMSSSSSSKTSGFTSGFGTTTGSNSGTTASSTSTRNIRGNIRNMSNNANNVNPNNSNDIIELVDMKSLHLQCNNKAVTGPPPQIVVEGPFVPGTTIPSTPPPPPRPPKPKHIAAAMSNLKPPVSTPPSGPKQSPRSQSCCNLGIGRCLDSCVSLISGGTDFALYSCEMGAVVGKMSNQWEDLYDRYFNLVDCFGVNFPRDLSARHKALLLGALFILDFNHFQL